MIRVSKTGGARMPDCDARYAIVRSAATFNKPGMEKFYPDYVSISGSPAFGKIAPILSPSPELFRLYRSLEVAKQWDRQSFENQYLPEFLSQMRYDPRAKNVLNGLVALDKSGQNIQLDCFCKIEEGCHRSIVAGLLQGAGCQVQTATGNDYSRYFDMYQKAQMTPMTARYLKAELGTMQKSAGRSLGPEFDAILDQANQVSQPDMAF